MKSLWMRVEELTFEIAGEVDHGECFFEEDMFNEFIEKLEKLKRLSAAYFEENKSEVNE